MSNGAPGVTNDVPAAESDAPAVGPDRVDWRHCRHPAEWQALAWLATIIMVLELVLYIIGPEGRASIEASLKWVPRGVLGPIMNLIHPGGVVGTVFGIVIVTTVFDVLQHWLKRAEVRSQAVEITAETFPDVAPVIADLCERFGLPDVRVFALRATQTSYSLGLLKPHVVVLPIAWLGLLTRDELRFVIGHELGHVKLGHTILAPFLGGSDWSGQGLTAVLQQVRSLLLSSYQQAQELSCDRVGVVACGGSAPAITALVKTGLGTPRGAHLDASTLAAQAAEVQHGSMELASRLSRVGKTQPALFQRLREIVLWAGLPTPASTTGSPTTPVIGTPPTSSLPPPETSANANPSATSLSPALTENPPVTSSAPADPSVSAGPPPATMPAEQTSVPTPSSSGAT